MSNQVIISLLNRATSGNEILAILDSFADNSVTVENAPTLEEIEF
jgi:hypothetical protein